MFYFIQVLILFSILPAANFAFAQSDEGNHNHKIQLKVQKKADHESGVRCGWCQKHETDKKLITTCSHSGTPMCGSCVMEFNNRCSTCEAHVDVPPEQVLYWFDIASKSYISKFASEIAYHRTELQKLRQMSGLPKDKRPSLEHINNEIQRHKKDLEAAQNEIASHIQKLSDRKSAAMGGEIKSNTPVNTLFLGGGAAIAALIYGVIGTQMSLPAPLEVAKLSPFLFMGAMGISFFSLVKNHLANLTRDPELIKNTLVTWLNQTIDHNLELAAKDPKHFEKLGLTQVTSESARLRRLPMAVQNAIQPHESTRLAAIDPATLDAKIREHKDIHMDGEYRKEKRAKDHDAKSKRVN